ncbi:hypothetical protein BAU15_01080 [Enterococcus sp. JM4C]|uniref:IS66 family transposase n=1 Tax=Candidatus Enterococcus huntleyi TaxID=1857217 RepID=UPI0023515336|nr:transposase [Enterococcus sp. JM4C]KAF1299269.1 hypothetical protein BAU15_01080 [Enterococcus sp. JM4C]
MKTNELILIQLQNQSKKMVERLKYYLNQEEAFHADETSYQVIQSHKLATYYWLFVKGKHSLKPFAYYHHAEGRSKTCLLSCACVPKIFQVIPKKSQNKSIPATVAVQEPCVAGY